MREGGLASQPHGEANQRAGVAGVGLQWRIDGDGGSSEKMEEGQVVFARINVRLGFI